jgi:hypothetical protein
MVSIIDWDDPSWVVAKFRLVGFVASGPELVPIPEREIVVLLERCLPLLPIEVHVTTDMLPLALPLACGAKATDKLALCCGARVIGKVGPVKLNPAPETVACEMVRFDLPLLLAAIDNALLLPSWTPPKFTLEEVKTSCPAAALEYRRNLRRTSFHQACLHWKTRRLIPSTLLLRASDARWGMMERLQLCKARRIAALMRLRLRVQLRHFSPSHRNGDRSRKARGCCF